jgi:pimeloyl-ACP methyl ester carboxylesterase
MKTIAKFILILACSCLLLVCQQPNDLLGNGTHDFPGLDPDRYITMKSTGLKVHYQLIGKGPIDVVLIPGWTNPLTVYTKQFEYFKDKARCIYIDLPGQGLSDAPEGVDYTMEMMADAIYAVVKKEGLKNFIAVGFSMGPKVLAQFHLKHPGMITKLVNLDGSFNPWPPETETEAREQYQAWLDGFTADILEWTTEIKEGFAQQLISESTPPELLELLNYFYAYPNWLLSNTFGNMMKEDVNQAIGWTFPILSIYSAPPENMEMVEIFFPNADIHILEGSGHVVQWEKEDIVNPMIWEFISDRP